MALLEIGDLTLRFGGLTAVKEVDLEVREGEIVSIIGPNGAGKTTVFNAATGIYEPTSGTIRFQDSEIIRPWGWDVAAAAALVGLMTAFGLGLLGLNIDHLWGAAIRRPHDMSLAVAAAPAPAGFEQGRVPTFAEALGGYLAGELTVTFSTRSWRVITPDGVAELARSRDEAEARRLRSQLEAVRRLEAPVLVEEGGGLAVRSAAGEPVMKWATRIAAERDLRLLAEGNARAANHRTLGWLGLVGGFALGAAGYLAVWMRSRRTTDLIARSGLARTFQNIRLFHNMTVLENVLVGMDKDYPSNWLGMLLWWPGHREAEKEANAKAVELLKFVELDQRQESLAKDLPYGQQRRLEIARALATRPKLLLLDEPAAGTNPTESEELMHLIRAIRDRGVTVLLIEHHMSLVMGISDRIAVLEHGVKIAEGTPEEVRTNQRVIDAYLGQGDDH
jgi:ABC-type branched-subunit amino acid transport system ATPase component